MNWEKCFHWKTGLRESQSGHLHLSPNLMRESEAPLMCVGGHRPWQNKAASGWGLKRRQQQSVSPKTDPWRPDGKKDVSVEATIDYWQTPELDTNPHSLPDTSTTPQSQGEKGWKWSWWRKWERTARNIAAHNSWWVVFSEHWYLNYFYESFNFQKG